MYVDLRNKLKLMYLVGPLEVCCTPLTSSVRFRNKNSTGADPVQVCVFVEGTAINTHRHTLSTFTIHQCSLIDLFNMTLNDQTSGSTALE